MTPLIFLLAIQSVWGTENIFATEKFFPSDVIEVFSGSGIETSARIENNPDSNEPVRRFLKSYNSLRPVAVLADETEESLAAAADFMQDVFRIAPGAKQITFFVSKFNSSGKSKRFLTKNFEVEKIG